MLRESQATMALAIEGSGTGIWDRNAQTGEIEYSRQWKAILGYSEHELTNRITDSYLRVHPDDLEYVKATIQAHFDGRTESYEVEHRLRCKDGRYKWVSSRGRVVARDSEGRALRMVGTTTDITAMRTMSEKLRQSVELLTSLTDEIPGLAFQLRRLPTGRTFFSYASSGIADIYEIEPERVAESDAALDAIIHPDDLPAYRASLDLSAAQLSPWDLEYRVRLPRKGLLWRQGRARPRRLSDGSILWHGFITDVTERKRIETDLQESASTDFLTRLPNRRHFMAEVEAELARLRREQALPAAVLMCDLDHFKSINDRWGHAAGDAALAHFAHLLRKELRRCDVAGRMGGEEFAVMLRGAGAAEAMAFARRLCERTAGSPVELGAAAQPIPITVSVGIATMERADEGAEASLSRSDRALYRAKAAGRNRIECEPGDSEPGDSEPVGCQAP